MPTQVNISGESPQEESDVIRASVRLKGDWIERLQVKCDVGRLLAEVALKQKCHGVKVICEGDIWRLVGCVCGVNGAREELVGRKRALESQTEDEICPRTCSDTCRDKEERPQVTLPERSKGHDVVSRENTLASRERGRSYDVIAAAGDGDAGKCQGHAVKKNSQKTKDPDHQNARSCSSFEQNPRGNSPNGKEGFKDSDCGATTKDLGKENTKVKSRDQRDEVSMVKVDAKKEKDTAADAAATTAADADAADADAVTVTTTATATVADAVTTAAAAAATTAAAADDDVADATTTAAATDCWTQKRNSTQPKQQGTHPKAFSGGDERGEISVKTDVQKTTTKNSDELRDRLNVTVDRQKYDFVVRMHSAELSVICRRCAVFEAYDDDGLYRWIAVEPKPDEDFDSIFSAFDDLILQVTKQVIWFPAGVCFDGLEDNIRATTCHAESVDMYFNADARTCLMVGRLNDIVTLILEITKLVEANRDEILNASQDQRTLTQVKGRFNSTEPLPRPLPPLAPPPPPSAGSPYFTILSQDQYNMELLVNSRDPIHLDLICGDLPFVCSAGVLVTFVDHNLKPFGRLAESIAARFNASLMRELSRIRSERAEPFPTGNLVHIPVQGVDPVKHLIHVVPPTEVEYPPDDSRAAANALKTVFANCIGYTNDTLKANSLCIPAVGCGIYPYSLVANAFVQALLEFDQCIMKHHDLRVQHLRHIQLVNNNARQMAGLIDALHRRLSNMTELLQLLESPTPDLF